jgi:endonuclease YncB( thermonuclease family)
MENFKVISIIDGDTFVVSPEWRWNNESGSHVRPTGYDTPEINTIQGQNARNKLQSLILSKSVQLGQAHKIDRGRLVCEVFLNGRNLADYFPEFKV